MTPIDLSVTPAVTRSASKLTGFLAEVLRGPIEEGVGPLQDRLMIWRWERQNRLIDRYTEIVRSRGLQGKTSAVPPKFVIPLVEAASMEDDDSIQDMWASLLAAAGDPERLKVVRSAFIEILKQLEPIDTAILLMIYREAVKWRKKEDFPFRPYDSTVSRASILEKLGLDYETYHASADNLIRLRLVATYLEEKEVVSQIDSDSDFPPDTEEVTLDHSYDQLCLTVIGFHFVRSCTEEDVKSEPTQKGV